MAYKERIRFNIRDDLCLLREVLCHNPFANVSRWPDIHENVVKATAKNFTLRAIKEHLEYILALWSKEDRANIRKSGTEEEYAEKEQLLQEVTDLAREFRGSTSGKGKAVKGMVKGLVKGKSEIRLREIGVLVRDASAASAFLPLANASENGNSSQETVVSINSLQDGFENTQYLQAPVSPSQSTISSDVGGPIRRRRTRVNVLKQSTLQFLEEKTRRERELKERELDIEQRKVACEERRLALQEQQIKLEREKFEMEKKEREIRLANEMQERQQRLAMEKQQQDIINFLLQRQQQL